MEAVMDFELRTMVDLLGLRCDAAEGCSLFGSQVPVMERYGHYAFIEVKADGVSVVFKEAPKVIPKEAVTDPHELHFAAFHLHSEGHEGYRKYSGDLPGGVAFGDNADTVLKKLGAPVASGGGQKSVVLNRRLPKWLRYDFGEFLVNVQFDEVGFIEMLTIFIEDQQLSVS